MGIIFMFFNSKNFTISTQRNFKKNGLMTKFSGVFFLKFCYYFIILIYILNKGIKVFQENT